MNEPINDSQRLYRLAELCTQQAKKNALQKLDDERVDKIGSKIQEIFDTKSDIIQNSSENQQAVYILCNRITALQNSLTGDSAKVNALKEKLAKALNEIVASLPAEFLKPQPTSELLKLPHEINYELLNKFPPESKEKINEFIGSMKVMYQQAKPEIFIKMLSAWIDVHKIPIARLPLSYEHIMEIIPHLHYVDLSNLQMMKFGFEKEQCLEKYRSLIASCGKPTYLSCAGGLIAEIVSTTDWLGQKVDDIQRIPLDDTVFKEICRKKSLLSLDLTDCRLSTGKEIELLNGLTKIKSLYVKNIFSSEYQVLTDETLPIITGLPKLDHLTITLSYVTNAGLEKLAECTQLKVLDATFHEEMKEHNLDCFAKLKNLTSLAIHDGFSFVDSDFKFLKDLTHLRILTLDRCYNLSNAVISKLQSQEIQKLNILSAQDVSCDFVKENKELVNKLQVLKLSQCSNIKEGSLQPLVEADLLCLHTLILEDSQISPDYPKFVGTATLDALLPLKGISSLRHLTINKCSQLTEDQIKTLREAMPHLETFIMTQ